MAHRQRADAGMRFAADAGELGHDAAAWARICSRRRTSRAGTAASPGSRRTRCWRVTTTPQSLVQGTLPPLTAGDFAGKRAGQSGQKAEKMLQRIRMGGVNVEKILTPDGTRRQGSARRRAGTPAVTIVTRKASRNRHCANFWIPKPKLNDADILTAIRLVMSTPEYQVT